MINIIKNKSAKKHTISSAMMQPVLPSICLPVTQSNMNFTPYNTCKQNFHNLEMVLEQDCKKAAKPTSQINTMCCTLSLITSIHLAIHLSVINHSIYLAIHLSLITSIHLAVHLPVTNHYYPSSCLPVPCQ